MLKCCFHVWSMINYFNHVLATCINNWKQPQQICNMYIGRVIIVTDTYLPSRFSPHSHNNVVSRQLGSERKEKNLRIWTQDLLNSSRTLKPTELYLILLWRQWNGSELIHILGTSYSLISGLAASLLNWNRVVLTQLWYVKVHSCIQLVCVAHVLFNLLFWFI